MSDILIPPHSVDAEQSVLGGLLRDNNAYDAVGDLRPEHFYIGDNAVIFEEIQRQCVANKPVDPISLAITLGSKIEGAQQYLIQMASNMPSAATIANHAAIVRDKAIKRAMITTGRDLAHHAATSTEEAKQILDAATGKLEKLAEARVKSEPVLAGDRITAHIEELQRREEGKSRGLSTGYPDIDKRIGGGFRGGQLHILAGRPKMGKTALALNIANHVAETESVLILEMEMEEPEMHDRNLASIGRIKLDHLITPSALTEMEWSNMTYAIEKLGRMQLRLDFEPALMMVSVRMKARAIKRKYGLKLLVIDYLQLMSGDDPKDSRNTQIEIISRGLKALAKELNISILCLSQLNRAVESRPNKRPLPSDLRDSGSIEQDADAVWLMYRDEYYNPDTQDRGIAEVNIPLCRQGAPGVAYVTYIGDEVRFESMAHGYHPTPTKTPAPRRGFTAD